jgi:hypothetical protein
MSPRPISILLSRFEFFAQICGDIRELMFISGVNDTSEKLFRCVSDTGDKFLIVDTSQK